VNQKIYPPESAGRRMIENVPLCHPEEKISDVRKRIFTKAKEFETLNYIYVVDGEKRLLGVFSIKDVLQKPEGTKIEDLMERRIIKVGPYTDQERVAILALKYNLKAIPVVDREGHFLGVVPSDIILEILHSEHIEDILKLGGIHKINFLLPEFLKTPSQILAKNRLPWLIFGLFGGILAAKVVTLFESSLRTYFILAAFIPLMVYMAAAGGVQTQALVIRNLIFPAAIPFRKYLFKEIQTGFLIALVLGVLLSLISIFWYQGVFFIGLILGISLILTIISAILIGFLIPFLLHKFKKDPAIGTGPFATIITDLVTLIVYFSVASLLLKVF